MKNWKHHARTARTTLAALALITPVLWSAAPVPARAQAAPAIVRDTEIEHWLRDWATPVIRAADLDPDGVNFILVQNSDLNAFVAGGQNVFIYTGLLMRTDDPGEIVGVIAHELGHISGGHLIRLGGALESAGYESMLGALLGIGTAIITGNGAAAGAVASGASSMATMRLLSYSRLQESSADQAALTYLDRAGMSPDGLVTFMSKLEDQELLPANQQTAYIRTHPLTRDRVEALSAGKSRTAHAQKTIPPEWREQHARMKAKLVAFINPERVAWDYGANDQSVAARYARAIAAYRQSHTEEALRITNSLLHDEPDTPYFHELKGQMLVDFGRVAEAVPAYKKAVELAPDAGLLRISYAHALIETARGGDSPQLAEAIRQLERARNDEPRSSRIQRLLATAYGRKGEEGAAKVYLAEEALLKRETDYAKRQAEAALAILPAGSKHRIRAQDIISYIEQNPEKE